MKLEIQTRLAHNIKRLRKNQNLTQFELAEKANISEAMVKSIEALNTDIINFFVPENPENTIESSLYSQIKDSITENYNNYLQKIFNEIGI